MDDLSLTDGVVPIVLLVAGGVALVLLLARRMTRAWVVTVGLAAFAVVLIGVGLNWLVTDLLELTPEDLSGSVVTWIAVAVGAIVLAAGSLIGTPPGRKVLGLVCGVVLLVTAGSQINAYFDEYPTVGALTGADTGEVDAFRDSPGRASSASEPTPVVDRWIDQLAIGQGTVDTAQIPATVSGFVARDAYVYTPQAYDVAQPPRLPVLILVAGQPGGPEDWFQSGELRENLDAFAAAHAGLAPVTVVVDPNGADTANTMCMDSAIAKAETYLVKDVRNWIIAELGIDSNPEHWTFGGWSYGGTCAIQMATRHPDLFGSFIDFQGEAEPALGPDRVQTVQTAFGGNTAEFDALVPLTVLSTTRFPNTWGYFASGSEDTQFTGYMTEVSKAAELSGMTTQTAIVPGQGHSWAVPINQMVPALTWLSPKLGFSR